MVLQNVYFFFEKVDERRGQPRFHDVSVFFMVFAGLAVLGFGAFFFPYLWGKVACGVATTQAVGEWMRRGEKGHPKSRKKLEKNTQDA